MAGPDSLRGRDCIHFGLRILFCASAIALLAVTARLATGWGGGDADENHPIVLPIVLATASLAIVTDLLALFLLFRYIGFITATTILDILVIILCGIGAASLAMGDFAFYWGLVYHEHPSVAEQAEVIVFALNILVAFRSIFQSGGPNIHSEACLFQPLTRGELEEYTIDKDGLSEDDHHHFCEFKETFNEFPPYEVSEDCRMWDRACQILKYLNIAQCYYEKKGDKKVGAEDTFSMEYLSHWHEIKSEDSFHDGPQGMLYGIRIRHSKPRDLPMWSAESICQWRDDLEDPKTTRAHIKLVTCTGAEAKEDELLHGELGPIANAIQCRLAQQEFKQTSLFSVQT
ncbi:hypothetical protein CNMCM5793_009081 [Aspergillus hiratsukae]|uniref:Uncharacterized protein n=1 Tax=Aspergillus hiratsukae TaxID=1194566 RepID=A0A8H6UF69_9EURO|nr:hypothetical protein CNMCM5793_009081 [Aspergillus hiratsukae]KAF7169439.1 hypothetical protein CNMCM6106_004344 [Aspergillus hiratsukae]